MRRKTGMKIEKKLVCNKKYLVIFLALKKVKITFRGAHGLTRVRTNVLDKCFAEHVSKMRNLKYLRATNVSVQKNKMDVCILRESEPQKCIYNVLTGSPGRSCSTGGKP